jgi:uncharacterized protein YehS (DUF1456 family)
MNNNDILRRTRYIFDFDDATMMRLFALGGEPATREQISARLKKDDDPECEPLLDVELAVFLNGLIIEKRGKRDGPAPLPEARLSNNAILRKFRIAMDFKADDLLETLRLADLHLSKHELSALFRKPQHKNYRDCKDQLLRAFLKGLQLQTRAAE